MRRLELDFLRQKPTIPPAAWLLLAVGLALSGLAATRYAEVKEGLARETALARQYEREQRLKPARGKAVVAQPEPGQQDQALLGRPWGELFARLEQTRPDKVAFLALEADGRKSEAVITAEAKTPSQMLDYVNTLRKQPGFSAVTLTSHIIDDQNPQHPLQFVVRLKWSGHEARP
jgi:Tfp pilus assembly protein PilN